MAGGPLITVADMLRDLSEDASGNGVFNPPSSSGSPFGGIPATTQTLKSGSVGDKGLPQSFEETYKQLEVALTQPGHTWTGLTQELCATLTTADKLVATAHSSLGELTQEVKRLEEIVKRGQGAILQLHATLDQDDNVSQLGK